MAAKKSGSARRAAKRPARRGIRRIGKTLRIAPAKTYRVLVEMRPTETARHLGEFRLDHVCMPQFPAEATGGPRLHAYASGTTVASLRKAGRKVEVLADATAEGKRLQKHVGKGDRFKGGRRGPRAIGRLI